MKPPNHGYRARVTAIDEGDELEFKGWLALDPRPRYRGGTGLVLVMGIGAANVLPVYTSDRIEILR